MATQLTVEYDEASDILYLDLAEPTPAQVMVEVAPGALVRKNTLTGAIEGIEIQELRRRASGETRVCMPINIDLSLGSVPS